MDGERNHHMHLQELGGGGDDEQLACLQECDHQQAWLPLPGGKAERVCVTRRGERNCVEKELGGFWPCAREDREVPGVIPVGEVEEEDEGEVDADLGLGGGNRARVHGHLEDQLSPYEIVQKQKNDDVLGQIY